MLAQCLTTSDHNSGGASVLETVVVAHFTLEVVGAGSLVSDNVSHARLAHGEAGWGGHTVKGVNKKL